MFNYSFSPFRCYPNPNIVVQFSGQGTQLLCREFEQSALALYDLKSQEMSPFMRLTAPGFVTPSSFLSSNMTSCFAGRDREFFVESCRRTKKVHIWSTRPGPHHQHNGQVQPLLSLPHEESPSVCYNEHFCILVSSCGGMPLKLWTPLRLPDSFSCRGQADCEMSRRSDRNDVSSEEDHDSGFRYVSYVPSSSGIWQVE